LRSLALPSASRRPVIGSGGQLRSRHFHVDPELRHRGEAVAPQISPARLGLAQIRPVRYAASSKAEAATWSGALRDLLEQNLLLASSVLLIGGALGWGLMLYNQIHSSGLFGSSVYSSSGNGETEVSKTDSMGASFAARSEAEFSSFPTQHDLSANLGALIQHAPAPSGGENAASVVARDWSVFEPVRQAATTPPPAPTAVPKTPARVAAAVAKPVPSQHTAPQTASAAPVQLASAEPTAPVQGAIPQTAPIAPVTPITMPRATRFLPPTTEPKMELADFETAPFPYDGVVPGTDRPFLTAGSGANRAHVNFRGRVLWVSKTFSDDHVLLHIPSGFDPKKPAVMLVFFHGHGATLARDVRDRQRLPDQISGAGTNAVLVAPQFAFDAADSSAGKFWEQDGFKRFLDEAAQKLAVMYGDPRSTGAFARMPIVLVSYSGGFGPTLSVLARGGANARIHGIVMLDSLYAGMDQFADWIANNRSGFFISSYTPYTAHHNAELEHLLAERAVPYGSTLPDNLEGTVAFLPADVPHRDFVTHAWTDNPIEAVLDRIDDLSPKIASATASARN
jgi:hypothetical protein